MKAHKTVKEMGRPADGTTNRGRATRVQSGPGKVLSYPDVRGLMRQQAARAEIRD